MHADCSTPWINIYSLPRSVVINRKAAGEILLSLSLESPATLRVSGQLVRLRRCLVHTCLHSVCVIRAHEYVCVCMRVCGCGNVGRNPTQSKRVNKCYNCIRAVFSLPGLQCDAKLLLLLVDNAEDIKSIINIKSGSICMYNVVKYFVHSKHDEAHVCHRCI